MIQHEYRQQDEGRSGIWFLSMKQIHALAILTYQVGYYIYTCMYVTPFFWKTLLFSSGRGFFLTISAEEHPGGPRVCTPRHKVWVPAGLRDRCSGPSKSRNLARNHGEPFRPARAEQAHGNPLNFLRGGRGCKFVPNPPSAAVQHAPDT